MDKVSPEMALRTPTIGSISPEIGGSETSPRADRTSSAHPEWEGLQSSFRDPNRDSEGLQPVSGRAHYASGGSSITQAPDLIGVPEGKVPNGWLSSGAVKAEQPADPEPDHSEPRRRKWWVIGACIALVVVILAAVLGGVLGSRAHQGTSQAPAHSAPPSPSASAAPLRIQSPGAWNGTGMHAFHDTMNSSLGYLVFQDHSGTLKYIPYALQFEPTVNITFPLTKSITADACNGTGLTGQYWQKNASDPSDLNVSFQLVYVNADGFLADQWLENAPAGDWASGNLSSHRIPAPTDKRLAMYLLYDDLGGINGSAGGKLFAGGTDGMIHQYSFDLPSKTWFPNSTGHFADTSVYTGASAWVAYSQDPDRNHNATGHAVYKTTLVLTDTSGQLRTYVQSNGADGDNKGWPMGGDWSDPRPASDDLKVSNDSSFEAVLITDKYPTANGYQEWLIYPSLNNTLYAKGILASTDDSDGDFTSASNALTSSFNVSKSLTMMQGSDLNAALIDDALTILFYQPDGASIGWVILGENGNDTQISGRFVLNNNGEWVVTSS